MKRLFTLLLFAAITLAAVAAVPRPAPAAAQGGVTWLAQYYNNPYLLNQPVATEQVNSVAFNWGTGSPVPGVNADNFSARFTADIQFSPGTYRFYILADDGVKLFAGASESWGQPVIDTYDQPRPGQTLTADVAYPDGGLQHVIIDFREVTGDAYIYVSWENLANGASGPNFPAPIASGVTWSAQYFNNTNLTPPAALVRNESTPSKNWGTGAPAPQVSPDNFSVRWTAVQPLNAGTYTVTVQADDGVRVWVNGVLVINEWHAYTGETYSNTFSVPTGQIPIVIEYYEATGNAFLNYSLTPSNTPTPISGAYATVLASALNVRDAPNATTGRVVTEVLRGQSYPVVGRNADSSWWQITANGVTGWVSGRYVSVTNAQLVQVTNSGSAPAPQPTYPSYLYGQCPGFLPSRLVIGGWGRVTPGLSNNLRAQPNSTSALLGQIPSGGTFSVIGGPVCAENTAWWQVQYYSITGWTAEGANTTYWLEPYTP
jgi:uncharacterized protein YgiM (DUF1202 family)